MANVATSSGDLPVGDVVEYRFAKQRQDWTAYLGMVLFLASWAMMFAALFFSYGAVRAQSEVWPPVDVPHLPLGLPALNTVVVALSSAALLWGLRSIQDDSSRRLLLSLTATTLLGVVFLGLQCVVWFQLYDLGLLPSSGTYGSVFYGLTWVHAAHVVVGLLALVWLVFQSYRGAYSASSHLAIRLWSMYWHFVGIVWGVLFVTVYVL